MDAVELSYPADVAATEMGRVNPTTALSDAVNESSAGGSSVYALKSTSCDNGSTLELSKQSSQLPGNPRDDDLIKHLHSSETNIPSQIPKSEDVQVHKKDGRTSRGCGGRGKRTRTSLLEDVGLTRIDDTSYSSYKQESCLKKCDPHDKTQFVKQRKNNSAKRGDRRYSKISTKAKCDPFSVKSGVASFSSAAAGNNFSAFYGLKTEVHEITKFVDDLSLNDLLSGTYQCLSLGNERGKKPANSVEYLLHSVRKACSVFQAPNVLKIDSCMNETTAVCPHNSLSLCVNGDNGETATTDLSSYVKDSCSKSESSAHLLDFKFDHPRNTLECLALAAPSKDLEYLLQGAAKPAASSRNAPGPGEGKQITSGAKLPPFPWSHYRANSDVAKLSTSRNTCQGRWARINYYARCMEMSSNRFPNLESLAYDEALVPPSRLNLDDTRAAASMSACTCNFNLSITLTSLASQVFSESGGDIKHIEKEEHSPSLVAAAQILVDIAAPEARRLNHESIMKWRPKLPSQTKARKLKSNGKTDFFIASASLVASSRMMRDGMEQVMPSKKPKLSVFENHIKDQGHKINGLRKGALPLVWSTLKPSTSPSKPLEDSFSLKESRHSTAYILKQSCTTMPPPAAKLGSRSCSSQRKGRKLM